MVVVLSSGRRKGTRGNPTVIGGALRGCLGSEWETRGCSAGKLYTQTEDQWGCAKCSSLVSIQVMYVGQGRRSRSLKVTFRQKINGTVTAGQIHRSKSESLKFILREMINGAVQNAPLL